MKIIKDLFQTNKANIYDPNFSNQNFPNGFVAQVDVSDMPIDKQLQILNEAFASDKIMEIIRHYGALDGKMSNVIKFDSKTTQFLTMAAEKCPKICQYPHIDFPEKPSKTTIFWSEERSIPTYLIEKQTCWKMLETHFPDFVKKLSNHTGYTKKQMELVEHFKYIRKKFAKHFLKKKNPGIYNRKWSRNPGEISFLIAQNGILDANSEPQILHGSGYNPVRLTRKKITGAITVTDALPKDIQFVRAQKSA